MIWFVSKVSSVGFFKMLVGGVAFPLSAVLLLSSFVLSKINSQHLATETKVWITQKSQRQTMRPTSRARTK
jgi:hypothetical protein